MLKCACPQLNQIIYGFFFHCTHGFRRPLRHLAQWVTKFLCAVGRASAPFGAIDYRSGLGFGVILLTTSRTYYFIHHVEWYKSVLCFIEQQHEIVPPLAPGACCCPPFPSDLTCFTLCEVLYFQLYKAISSSQLYLATPVTWCISLPVYWICEVVCSTLYRVISSLLSTILGYTHVTWCVSLPVYWV